MMIFLSYALLGAFVFFFLLRSVKLARLPIHLRWELAPVPHEKGKGKYGGSYLEESEWWTKPQEKDMVAEFLYMFQEILFLKALFEHKRSLWFFSFPFHFGLYLLTGALGLLVVGGLASAFGLAGSVWGFMSAVLPLLMGLGYALGLIGAVGLFLVRLSGGAMKNSTSFASFFNVVLLGSMFGTGLWAVTTMPDFTAEIFGFAGALFTADTSFQLSGPLQAHVILALVFLAYLPFTQMMHFVAKYFTYHEVRWDDRPLDKGGKMEKEIAELMGQPVTWAGAHLGADGKKNWVDIATASGKQENGK